MEFTEFGSHTPIVSARPKRVNPGEGGAWEENESGEPAENDENLDEEELLEEESEEEEESDEY